MTATFTAVPLVNERVLISGVDQFGTEGKVVVDGTQWASVNRHKEYDQASEAFDKAVEEFFAPLTAAADKLDGVVAAPPTDSIGYVVLHEGVESKPGTDEVLVKLTNDSVVLRIIEAGNFDRLVWVEGQLEVLSA